MGAQEIKTCQRRYLPGTPNLEKYHSPDRAGADVFNSNIKDPRFQPGRLWNIPLPQPTSLYHGEKTIPMMKLSISAAAAHDIGKY